MSSDNAQFYIDTFHERLLSLRQVIDGKKESEAAWGDRVGISKSTIGQWKRGKSFPSADKLIRLLYNTNISADWLLFGENRKDRETVGGNKEGESMSRIVDAFAQEIVNKNERISELEAEIEQLKNPSAKPESASLRQEG